MARIRALPRRLNPRPDGEIWRVPERLEIDDLILDEGARTCRRDGDIIELTTAEFDLLSLFLRFLRSNGRTVHRKELSKQGFRPRLVFVRSQYDVHVSNLRRKLGSLPDGTERIRGIRNIGYIYARAVADQSIAGCLWPG